MTHSKQSEPSQLFNQHIEVTGDGWWHPKTSKSEFLDDIEAYAQQEVNKVLESLKQRRQKMHPCDTAYECLEAVELAAIESYMKGKS